MRNRTVPLVLALSIVGAANAASQRTFVASYGVDTNSCSLTQPCRQFARALTQTLPGGEIIVLDSAGYGVVSITQDVSIIAPPGIYAGISVFAGSAGVELHDGATKVKLQGLTINGQGGGVGIFVVAGDAEVDISDCEVSGMAADGLQLLGNTRLSIRDSRFLNNAGYGISYAGGAGPGSAVVSAERVVARGNVNGGIYVFHATGFISESVIERNGNLGIDGPQGYLNIRDSRVMSNASSGVRSTDGYLRVERSTVSVNGGWGVALKGTAEGWIVDSAIYDNQQSALGTSQVCACDATAKGYVSGSALHGTIVTAVNAVGPVYTFGDNRSVKFWIGDINPVPLQ
jgi:hypothetical protein